MSLLYKRLTIEGLWFFSICLSVLILLAAFCVFWYGIKKQKFGRICKAVFSGVGKVIVKCVDFLIAGQKVKTIYQDKSANYSKTEKMEIPVKKEDEKFIYQFAGWDKTSKKTGEKNPEPVYIKRIKKCYVNVYDDDRETLLKSFEIDYGSGVDLSGIVPFKPSTKQFNFEFIGWDKPYKNITQNTNICAVYRAIPIRYKYTFLLDNEKTIVSFRKAIYGSRIILPPDPVKPEKDGIHYEFVGWKNYKEGMVVTGDAEFIAQFDEIK